MKKERDDSRLLSLKITRIMKITAILILTGILQVSAVTYAQEHRISVAVENGTFYDVVSQIEKQSEFMFFYKSEEIDNNQRINLKVKDKLVSEILSEITKNNNLTYKITGKHIIITKATTTSQAPRKITGIITDENGEPIIGANIVEKGTTNGTITDIDGRFSLDVADKSVLIVSYIGYDTQTISVTSKSSYNIKLAEDTKALEEVVVIGYGSARKKDVTGALTRVNVTEKETIPNVNPVQALRGSVAGVRVIDTGMAGADGTIQVRGTTSITASNDPLIVLDGVPFSGGRLSDINTNDIETIDVLKDASITAIYGAKGGNGVVVVTTKSAKAGKIQVSFNAHLSTSHLSKKLDLMNSAEFARYQYEWSACNGSRSSNAKFFRANFGNPQDLDMYYSLPTHDWQDEVMGENPINYSTNVTIGGGTDKMRFTASLTQSEDKGIIMGSGVRRTNLNIKTAIDITKNLTLHINPKFTFRRDQGAGGDNIGTGGIIDVLRYRPTNGLREFGYIDPSYADPDEEALFTYTNPKSDIAINQQNKYAYNYTNAISLEWKPVKGLVLRTEATLSLNWKDQYRFWGALTGEGTKNNSLPVASIQKDQSFKYIWTNTASYGFSIKDKHNFSMLLGQEIYHSQNKKNFQKNRYFPRAFEAGQAWDNMGFGTPQLHHFRLQIALLLSLGRQVITITTNTYSL